MPDWEVVRRTARGLRARVGDRASSGAEHLLSACLEFEGLVQYHLSADDPLLAGACAVLDRDAGSVWLDIGMPLHARRFCTAHELGHLCLHTDTGAWRDVTIDEAPATEPSPCGVDRVVGYSPVQRREVEASVFAAELLAPVADVCREFTSGRSLSDIAAALGVSLAVVEGQLVESLSLPPGGTDDHAVCARSVSTTVSALDLDESQREAAHVVSGPLLVAAGPGTGKTRTLIARIVHLAERGAPADGILVLTFSNKACDEIRDRLSATDGGLARLVRVFTFHGYGLELLRSYGDRLGLPASPRIVDTVGAVSLLERELPRLDLDELEYLHDPAYPLPAVLREISRAKDELVGPAQYAERIEAADPRDEVMAARVAETARVYAVYEALLREKGLLDYGELVVRTVELLDGHPDVLGQVRAATVHVLVDEYQDINRATAEMVRRVAGDGANLWVVGDLRQAIYRFRGASAANIRRFHDDYPGGRTRELRTNYRSAARLVHLVSRVASAMDRRSERTDLARERDGEVWTASRSELGEIELVTAGDDRAQAAALIGRIRMQREAGIPYGAQAILCRTNAHAAGFADALTDAAIPVLYVGELLDRPEVLDMLALMQVCAAGGGGDGLGRVLGMPDYGVAPADAILMARCGAADGAAPAAALVTDHLNRCRKASVAEFLRDYLFVVSGYLRWVLRRHDAAAWQARASLYHLLLLARTYDCGLAGHPETALCGFLDHVRRMASMGDDGRLHVQSAGIDAVRVMTVHAAKGLEFPVVYVPHVSRGAFPPTAHGDLICSRVSSGRSAAGADGESAPDSSCAEAEAVGDDETRLFFVAISRARDRLVVLRSKSTGTRARGPSFLWELLEASAPPGTLSFTAVPSRPAVPSDVSATPPVDQRPELAVDDVATYMKCHRRYRFDCVDGLGGDGGRGPYRQFARSLRDTLSWAEARAGCGTPASLPEAIAWFDGSWVQSGVAVGALTQLYRRRAVEAISNMLEWLSPGDGFGASVGTVRLACADVRIRFERLARRDDGTIEIEVLKAKRPRPEDLNEPYLALYRAAARQTWVGAASVRLRLRYMRSGAIQPVPEDPKRESARLAKFEAAAHGIVSHDFSPMPSRDQCPRCPYLFICPGRTAR